MFSFRIPRAQWHAEINTSGHTISINILPLRGNGANDLCKKKFKILLSEVALHDSAHKITPAGLYVYSIGVFINYTACSTARGNCNGWWMFATNLSPRWGDVGMQGFLRKCQTLLLLIFHGI